MSKIILLVNDQVAFSFVKDESLDKEQFNFLDKMDSDMSKGIKINGELFRNSNKLRKRKTSLGPE